MRAAWAASRPARPRRRLHTIRRSDAYVEQPWANGRGVTREIAADRSASTTEAPFQWRLSIAALAPPGGPFSEIPGVDRVLTLLDGELALAVGEGAPLAPLRVGEPFGPFAADAPTDSRVHVAGSDLNVMWDRRRASADVAVAGAGATVVPDADTVFFVGLDPAEAVVRADGVDVRLAYLDSLEVAAEPPAPPAPLAVVAGQALVARLSTRKTAR